MQRPKSTITARARVVLLLKIAGAATELVEQQKPMARSAWRDVPAGACKNAADAFGRRSGGGVARGEAPAAEQQRRFPRPGRDGVGSSCAGARAQALRIIRCSVGVDAGETLDRAGFGAG